MPRLRTLLAATAAAVGLAATATAPAAATPSFAAADTGHATPRIIGGTAARSAALPWLAFVSIQLADGGGESCSGTVVAPRLVLTAGHCAENLATGRHYPASDLMVTTGTADLSAAAGQTIGVARTIINPGFDAPAQVDDAALLVLARPTTAPAIALATSPPAAGTIGTVAGFGETDGTSLAPPALLHQAPAQVLDQSSCAAAWGLQYDADAELCTLDPPSAVAGACRGDSGGPLLADQHGATVELGLAIYVATDCATSDPDVYTRADAIAPWVAAAIASLASPASTPTAVRTAVTRERRPLLRDARDGVWAARHGIQARPRR